MSIIIAQRVRNILAYAFALSLLAHALVGPLLPRFPRAEPVPDAPIMSIDVRTPPPVFTPPPTPQPTPHVQHSVQPRPLTPQAPPQTARTKPDWPTERTAPRNTSPGVAPSTPGSEGTAAPENAPSPSPMTPAPSPSPTPKALCAQPHVDAHPLQKAIPELPEMARAQGLGGTVEVRVDLDAKSRIIGTSIMRSAGSPLLDRAAVEAARGSSFATQIDECVPVSGSYRYVVEFQ